MLAPGTTFRNVRYANREGSPMSRGALCADTSPTDGPTRFVDFHDDTLSPPDALTVSGLPASAAGVRGRVGPLRHRATSGQGRAADAC
jgi:hypothetical protein